MNPDEVKDLLADVNESDRAFLLQAANGLEIELLRMVDGRTVFVPAHLEAADGRLVVVVVDDANGAT